MASHGRKVRDAGAGAKKAKEVRRGEVPRERLLEVAEHVARGQRYQDMQFELAAKWKVTTRTIREYRNRVLIELHDLIPDHRRQLEEILTLERFEDLYEKCLKAGDFRTAMHVTKNRALVAGVIGPLRVRHEHEFPKGIPVTTDEKMSDEQAHKVLERAARAVELAKSAAVASTTNGHGTGEPPNGTGGANG